MPAADDPRIRNRAAVTAEIAARRTQVATWPFEIQFSAEHRCNLRCVQCGSTIQRNHGIVPLMDRKLPVRAYERFRKLDAALPSFEWLSLTGSGEPLIAPDLPAILAHARTSGCAIAFHTNGTLWNEARAAMVVDLGVDEIRFSIDGATAATFERIRVNAKFDKVCAAVRMLVAAKQQKGAQRPRVSFSSNLMHSNLDELPSIVDLAADLGAVSVVANNTIVYEPAMAHESLAHHGERTQRVVQAAMARAAARGVEFVNNLTDVGGDAALPMAAPASTAASAATLRPPERLPVATPAMPTAMPTATVATQPPIPATVPLRPAAAFELPASPCAQAAEPAARPVDSIQQPLQGLPADLPAIVHACSRPWTGLYVENDGFVRVCCYDSPAIGNLDEQTLDEIWNGPHAQHLRRSFLAGKPPEGCANCFIFAKHQKRDDVFVQPLATGRSHVDAPGLESKLFGIYPVHGWAIEPDGVARVDLLLDGVLVGSSACDQLRPDVAQAFPGFPDGERCGWRIEVDVAPLTAGPCVMKLVVHTKTGRHCEGKERLVTIEK